MKFIALFTAGVLSFPFPFPGIGYMKSGSRLQRSNQGSHPRYMNSGAEPKFSKDHGRKNPVKEAFLHTWSGYKKYGATLVDSLTTLWLMDFKDEFKYSVDSIKKIDFTVSNEMINYLEITISYLGGLTGAYDLSGEDVLLKQAIVLADQLLLTFETPSGYPVTEFIFGKGPIPGRVIIAIVAIRTCQLEFTRLTQITKDKKYEEKAMTVIAKLDKLEKPNTGLYPV
ncbi:glycoside hydrolase family 47 protein [Conidiobolus coronatus NRRL 28638]|uniref:alpha-1,2-Mannosidase n=1 Tax=Conidiobolus coronatus (strain ATCC 28846 / CBS 209.66 / NRRL 28638) TaxID=796925 RepID=A0A137NT83_CONC2|nr:glycoside hydrolase family 47 protein [Conidiobolus coronatus NRRL 28638]|eukprot:KXN65922.1 glycoside hydrolase family 47 protein [Conidiobolus coronatus NRRL 28638]